MKLSIINALGGILANLKINKIIDKEAKETVNRNFLAVRKVMRPFDKDRDELLEKFRSDWKDEIAAILSKREGDYEAYYTAERDMNVTILKALEEDVEVSLTPVKADHLYDPDLWGNDATLGEIEASVSYLIRYGVAEE